jgi:hypothetical protein
MVPVGFASWTVLLFVQNTWLFIMQALYFNDEIDISSLCAILSMRRIN